MKRKEIEKEIKKLDKGINWQKCYVNSDGVVYNNKEEIIWKLEAQKKNLEKINDKELIKKIKEWHQKVVNGLVNGLTHKNRDERKNDINWVRKRLNLFESFSRCIMDTIWENDNQYNEKWLKEVSEEGYKLEKVGK